jgi:outer membrane protein assembly factor BamB
VPVLGALLLAASALVATSAAHGARSSSISASEWPSYLDGPQHHSYDATEKAITTANTGSLKQEWKFLLGGGYLSSPVVANGAVFIGANNGWLYKLSAAKGTVLAKAYLGTVNIISCPPPPTGMVSTATVAIDPHTGQTVVYASGANGYLYALNASNLSVKWRSAIALPSKTVNDYFDWSSPTVANGRIYVGVSSNCDSPLVRGGLIAFNQVTGAKISEYYTVPKGQVGASIWSSVAVGTNGDVFATTGNGPLGSASQQLLGSSESILKLSPTLQLLGRFQVPLSDEGFDTDFGASPTLFGPYVGACNKTGIFYALSQTTMKLAWKRQVSGPGGGNELCIAAVVWNGQHLFLATPAVTIGTRDYVGSVQERNPNGSLVWSLGLPNAVDGSPTMDGAGVLAVGTYDVQSTPNATYLINAATGKVLRNVVQGGDFAQSSFAENWLFVANESGVYAYGVGPIS